MTYYEIIERALYDALGPQTDSEEATIGRVALAIRDALPTDEWVQGWRAGRECLQGEVDAAYRRGLHDRPRHVVRLDLLSVVVAFIAGFVICAAIAAGGAS